MMNPLDKAFRNKLEKTIQRAREVAEAAARAVLEQLGVEQATPYSHLSEEDRSLRRRLRARGRQLGDVRDSNKQTQEIDRLIEEVAYEHWHRMLFARFLAENGLLMYFEADDSVDGVPVTLEECEELASELGYRNSWDVAARMAARMLPQIFRPDSPVFGLMLPPEREQELEKLLAELPVEVFTASDSLGWVYQFWQAKKKKEVNKSAVKIGARELPAVTQLFTEPYMVSFLLDNSLGAWWAARRLTENDLQNATTEEELRQKARFPGIPLEYLRFTRGEDGRWVPVGGNFDKWPNKLSELKVLDPCCGSGHFLVAAFLMLVPMRMELEGLSASEACETVIRDNLHGLELDRRCVELAAFAMALTAWRYTGTGGYRVLPSLKIACTGLAINTSKKEWLGISDGGNDTFKTTLEALYEQFKNAPVLGSLIDPKNGLKDTLFTLGWEEVAPLLYKAIKSEEDMDETEMGVAAYGMAEAARILIGKYHLVITNVPYLKRGKQNQILQNHCDNYFQYGKDELATVFAQRCIQFLKLGGQLSVVMPQFWTFHKRSKKLRYDLLQNISIRGIATLGANAFEAITGEIVNVGLYILEKSKPIGNLTYEIDVTGFKLPIDKDHAIKMIEGHIENQSKFINNVDYRIIFDANINNKLLSEYAISAGGLQTFDKPRFIQCHWEHNVIENGWVYLQSTINKTTLFSGRENVLLWEDGKGGIYNNVLAMEAEGYSSGVWRAGIQVWQKRGVLFKLMGERLEATIYTGQAFENTTGVIIPNKKNQLLAIWCYCSSDQYSKEVRKIDKKVAVTNGNLVKVPFDPDYWQKVANEKYPNGLPKPYSDDPTQWFFHGHPSQSGQPLQVAIARLLGYRWPAELDQNIELSEEARNWVRKSEELLPFADEDGVVCIPSVRGEASAADRLLNLLAKSYEEQNVNEQVSALLTQADYAGRSLELWLRDMFFTQHCKLFHHRPFIWHVWDGLPDGFSALVNYHKLDRKNLETLIYTYLGDWMKRQKDEISSGIDGAADRLAAAESLKKSLELILQGDNPYDIFVRWKPLDKQSLGWEPDLNDGVRLNIRPFLTVPDVGKRGAGILRDKPNIHWKKDRGKDTPSSPWYQLGPQYGGNLGDRINDHHLTLAEKIKARAAHRKENV